MRGQCGPKASTYHLSRLTTSSLLAELKQTRHNRIAVYFSFAWKRAMPPICTFVVIFSHLWAVQFNVPRSIKRKLNLKSETQQV